jgi:sigma-B regulation protein RsbU (phosphoserine phosphatase)
MENIRVAMNRGAFDFVTKPINLDDLEKTIHKALRESAVIKEALHTRDQLIAIQQELNVATEIQMSMLPRALPSAEERRGVDIFATMKPAKEVGGDLYDFFIVGEHRIAFVIGDVSGKGVPAALLMGISRTLLRGAGRDGLSAHDCLERVNRVISEEILPSMFVTVFYGIFDAQTGELEYCSGGHNPPYLLGHDGTLKALNEAGGLPLGVLSDAKYSSARVQLRANDAVVVYTDGVTEATDLKEEEFGEKRLEDLLSRLNVRPAQVIVEETVAAVNEFAKGVPQRDDITCLALRYVGNGANPTE